MKLTKNYILTRDETSETGLSVHKRHTYEYVGVIGAPFEGEWGWDYEIEVMHDYDVVITRACLPPHVIRFFKLDQVTDDEPCLPYKELTIEAEPFWIDNEAMGMSISSKLMLFEPCNFPPRLFYIENTENIVPVDLSNRIEANLEEQEIHIALSDNFLIEWNSSRQIGGWVDTRYRSPATFWIRTYKIERTYSYSSCNESTVSDDENLSIVLHTESVRPNGLHGEFGVDFMQAYEHENKVYIIARDGWRIRNETADSERLRNYRID